MSFKFVASCMACLMVGAMLGMNQPRQKEQQPDFPAKMSHGVETNWLKVSNDKPETAPQIAETPVPSPQIAASPQIQVAANIPDVLAVRPNVVLVNTTRVPIPAKEPNVVYIESPAPDPVADTHLVIHKPEVKQPKVTVTVIDDRYERLKREHEQRMNEWRGINIVHR